MGTFVYFEEYRNLCYRFNFRKVWRNLLSVKFSQFQMQVPLERFVFQYCLHLHLRITSQSLET